MDLEQLTEDICSAYLHDPVSAAQLPTPSAPKWSLSEDGMLLLNERLYVPDHDDLQLRVLWYKHDHPLTGHYGQNKTLELIRRDYAWPGMRDFIKDYCNSCTVCGRIKPHQHKPYGLLKPLPIPKRLWDSISMDLIEQLPASAGHTAILVVDRLSKQGIFIPTHDTLTAVQLAGLFVLHVFSKHRVLGHVTSDRSSEFVSHFFCSLGAALGMKLHKDLASTCALCPCAHSVLFWKTDQTEKETRGNQSRYSDWRYRWKQLDIYTKCMIHLEKVQKDGEWGTCEELHKMIREI